MDSMGTHQHCYLRIESGMRIQWVYSIIRVYVNIIFIYIIDT